MVVLGVDTDAKGSIAVLDLNDLTHPTLDIYPIPHLYKELSSGTKRIQVDYPVLITLMTDLTSYADVAWLEEQRGMPGQDSAAMFGFGNTYGDIRTATSAGFQANQKVDDIRFVHSLVWKPSLRLDDDKKKALALASALFPECKAAWKLVSKHTSAAEAALIALYGASNSGVILRKGVTVKVRPKACSEVVESLLNGSR